MSGEDVREKVGKFFVRLTAQLYGGEIQKNGNNSSNIGNPDIINWERDQAYESKASISSDHHKIHPKQIEHYQELIASDFPLTNPEAYYFLWQHRRRGISKFKGKELERNLTLGINRLLVVSFDVILAGTNVWETTGENSWGTTYMFRSSERRELTYNVISELNRMNLDPSQYDISKEIIPEKQYKYKWWYLPEFEITKIIKKGLRGVKRK